jgi:hypothetical protein
MTQVVANVLVVERRKCQCCQLVFEAPSPVIHELSASHSATDFEQSLSPMKYPPPSDTAELRAIRYIDVTVHYCHYCWRENITWQKAAAIRPAPPRHVPTAAFNGLHIKPSVRPATLDELMA